MEEILTKHDFIHYEVSNWAKSGYESEHNLTYWRNEEYYGVGLGASGYIGETRYKNTINLSQYLNRVFINEKENVSIRDKFIYQVMLNLRTIEGLDLKYLKDKEAVVKDLINKGLLIKRGNKVIPTYEGMMILDQIVLQLI